MCNNVEDFLRSLRRFLNNAAVALWRSFHSVENCFGIRGFPVDKSPRTHFLALLSTCMYFKYLDDSIKNDQGRFLDEIYDSKSVLYLL